MNTERKGRFIVFEGNDGVGKTTQAARLAEFLKNKGYEVLETKEPGGISETSPLRQLFLDERLKDDGISQLLLVTADRRIHLLLQIVPALKAGKIVICDRFTGSTIVYQHFAKSVPWTTVTKTEYLARVGFDGRKVFSPDLVILLDVSPEVGKKRRQGRQGQKKTHFDKDEIQTQKRRESAYLKLAKKFGWEVVDGSGTEEEVFKSILTALEKRTILPKAKR